MQSDNSLIEPDPEIERTFRARRQKQREEKERLKQLAANSQLSSAMAAREDGAGDARILRDFVAPGLHEANSSIRRPAVEAHNFELKPALISMVQQS